MILLWLKIIYYKMIKLIGRDGFRCPVCGKRKPSEDALRDHVGNVHPDDHCRLYHVQPCKFEMILSERAAPGEKSAPPRARHEEPETSPEVSTVSTELLRLELFEAEKRTREIRALLEHDPRHCPCAGRHYPSPGACRWCACHRDLPQGIVPGSRLAELYTERTEIMDEAHPDWVEQLTSSHRPCSVCGAPDHARMVHSDQTPRLDAYENDQKLLAVRPSAEILCCPLCGHPQHAMNDGRCAFLVPGTDKPNGFARCSCMWSATEELRES